MGIYKRIRSWQIGGDFKSSLRLTKLCWSATNRWLPERFEVPVTIKLSGRRAPFTFRDKNDIDIFRDIFLKKEYDLGLSENAQVIFDIGSNSGFSVLYSGSVILRPSSLPLNLTQHVLENSAPMLPLLAMLY